MEQILPYIERLETELAKERENNCLLKDQLYSIHRNMIQNMELIDSKIKQYSNDFTKLLNDVEMYFKIPIGYSINKNKISTKSYVPINVKELDIYVDDEDDEDYDTINNKNNLFYSCRNISVLDYSRFTELKDLQELSLRGGTLQNDKNNDFIDFGLIYNGILKKLVLQDITGNLKSLKSIEKMITLEYLSIEWFDELSKIYEYIIQLHNLKHLVIYDCFLLMDEFNSICEYASKKNIEVYIFTTLVDEEDNKTMMNEMIIVNGNFSDGHDTICNLLLKSVEENIYSLRLQNCILSKSLSNIYDLSELKILNLYNCIYKKSELKDIKNYCKTNNIELNIK